ncbi:hypothetical protein N7499_008824 [Penicillium canescens]|nr:hypothetical protein N7499_008824 [Penicillium canescens]KAJ6159150.1 hypothetical protein N7485_011976 [Penicillium canescens]
MISHPNVVNLLDAFEQSRILYLAYELMDLSLEQLQSGIQLKESDLAFICKELLHGLWYIHRDLGVCHTALTYDNVFISSQGRVKIANIAACLLERHQGSEQFDIKSIGIMICKVLEPGLSTHDLQASHASLSHGSDSLRAFISTTATETIQALLQVWDRNTLRSIQSLIPY